ncbi:hypothetical protein I4U23_003819 [Adineta vaga]|nr:hypothetical protein I4U23_003819 [Adineta vaga]
MNSADIAFFNGELKMSDPTFRCSETRCQHWNTQFESDWCGRWSCKGIKCRDTLRVQFYRDSLLHTANTHINEKCWATMICLTQTPKYIPPNDPLYAHLTNVSCNAFCWEPDISCSQSLIKFCPPLFEFPAQSIGWSDLHFVYSWNRTGTFSTVPNYICYNEQRCAFSPSNIRFTKISAPTTILSCELASATNFQDFWLHQVPTIRTRLQRQCSLAIVINENYCSQPTQFRCGNKCLSKHRLRDNLADCVDRADEVKSINSCALKHAHRWECISNMTGKREIKCLPMTHTLQGERGECKIEEKIPHFPTLCDGHIQHTEVLNGEVKTDETNCEAWQYGADEAECFHVICQGLVGYPCLLRHTAKYICLPFSNVSDGIVDCLGATDEQQACENNRLHEGKYRCLTNGSNDIQTKMCIGIEQVYGEENGCPIRDPNRFVLSVQPSVQDLCSSYWAYDRRLTAHNLICSLDRPMKSPTWSQFKIPQFSLSKYNVVFYYARNQQVSSVISKSVSSIDVVQRIPLVINSTSQRTSLIAFQCNGGIPIYSDNDIKCLCPPFLYGAYCENQNQRISVTLKIGAPEWRVPFVFVIYLFDETYGIVNSYNKLRFVSTRDCNTKFNFHLLYSSRPKLSNRIYSVRIDLFEMITFKYRGSWLFPILFPFLPVYRLPVYVTVPFVSISSTIDCPLKCHPGHGRCVSFLNTNKYFCKCQTGWTGLKCETSYECNCSPDSICFGTSNNKSICVCPVHKFGRRCYLNNTRCEQPDAKKCQNGGQCIPGDMPIHSGSTTTCVCPQSFHGDTCQWNDTRIDLSIAMPNKKDSILVHFITANMHMRLQPYFPILEWNPHERATTLKKLQFDKNTVTIYWQHPFHLIFAEYDQNLYLLFTQLTYKASVHLTISLKPRFQCPSIRNLVNSTIVNYPRLQRIKYYHIPCQEKTKLKCFHDEDHYICLCTDDRRANCFTFDYHSTFSCQQLSYCENGGQCFQNNAKCPTTAICVCPKCYLGTRCQLSIRGFNLPLDVILGYEIRPNMSFKKQSLSVQISGIITILMFTFGIVNGTLSIKTFQQKELQKVGSGIYLFIASIMSISTILIFTIKYFLVVITQIRMITNRQFLFGQCVTIDFLLKISLQIGDWLYAAVASERLVAVIKNTNFKKKRSLKIVKWVVLAILLITIGSSISESLHRQLIDDEDEERIWCIVRQTNFLNLFTSITTVMHFVGPFLINIISAFGIVYIRAKRRWNFQKEISLNQHMQNQFRRHKYLVISPIGLILLALPRIILAFQLECMKSAHESVVFFLLGYFISFLPSLLLFIIFVLPSSMYRKAFKKTIRTYQLIIRRWFYHN